MFAMICIRPGIAQAMGVISRFMANMEIKHQNIVKKILRYIKGTSDVALYFGGSKFSVKGYIDSHFASDPNTRKSISGYVFTLIVEAVSWVLKLQTIMDMNKGMKDTLLSSFVDDETVTIALHLGLPSPSSIDGQL